MNAPDSIHPALFSRLVDGLYVEAMVMADEARSYFDQNGERERADLDLMQRLSYTCESLKVTTRLMHVIAWLLSQRAWQRGELSWEELSDPRHCLGEAAPSDPEALQILPEQARALVVGSEDLFERVRRLADSMRLGSEERNGTADSPTHRLLEQLRQSF